MACAGSLASLGADAAPDASWPGPPDYEGIEVLSPMVRGASLPLRLSCLRYGAGLVYHGVVIDRRVLEAVRVENAAFGCVDYVHAREKRVVFSTCQAERKRVIFQVGSADPALAVQAALHVCPDVRGVDVNMGCTAPFSASGGMGAALLDKPELAAEMLRTLRRELPEHLSVTCKIRLLPTLARTRDFLQLCERSGASAVALHLRTQEENRNNDEHPAHWEDARALEGAVRIPLIANGDFFTRKSIDGFWRGLRGHEEEAACGLADVGGSGSSAAAGSRSSFRAVMIARGALWDPSVFHRGGGSGSQDGEVGALSYDDVVRDYLATAVGTGNNYYNTKWALKEMCTRNDPYGDWLGFGGLRGKDLGQLRKRVDDCKDMPDLCGLFGVPYDGAAYPPGAHGIAFSGQFLPPTPELSPSPPPLPEAGASAVEDDDGDEYGNTMWLW